MGNRPADDVMVRYHDEEWGVPVHDDRVLFELLILEGAQAGLSWEIVLRRREGYRRAFEGFEIERIASYGETEQRRLLADLGIIRNRAKIASAIDNARGVLALQEEFGSFDAFLWHFVDGRPRQKQVASLNDLPAQTVESAAMSRELRKRGLRFVGPTICYALMQGAGLVNDHLVGCFRHEPLSHS